MTDKKNIITVTTMLVVKDWEFMFPMLVERSKCWDFIRQWMKFVRDPDARVFDCSAIMKVRLHGMFSGEEYLRDDMEATTSTVIKIEKISPPEEKSLAAWLKSWMFWPKKVDQMYRLTTESGSTFTVRLKDAAVETRNQLWTARFGAPDEVLYRGTFA